MVRSAAQKSGIGQVKTEAVLEAILETIVDTVASGEKIKIIGFGSFERAIRAPKKARNVYANEEVLIPARPTPVFKPGSFFKDVVRGI